MRVKTNGKIVAAYRQYLELNLSVSGLVKEDFFSSFRSKMFREIETPEDYYSVLIATHEFCQSSYLSMINAPDFEKKESKSYKYSMGKLALREVQTVKEIMVLETQFSRSLENKSPLREITILLFKGAATVTEVVILLFILYKYII